jgi:hypothetical protein
VYIHIHNESWREARRDTQLETQIRQRLARFENRITDVEVHLEEGHRGGPDLKCTLEARVEGQPPVAVAEHGDSVDRAILGAARKAVRALDDQLGSLGETKGH